MSWQNSFVYRFSFLLWRLESIILFLSSYLFWLAIFQTNNQILSYNQQTMLTYIIGTLILRNLIFSSKISQIAEDIATGGLNKYLVQPIKYFNLIFALDLGERVSNILLLTFELLLIFLIFKPNLFIQTNIFYLLTFFACVLINIFLYFYLSLIISLTTFWYPEHAGWPQRFLFDTTMIFLTGGWFPLDLLPKPIMTVLEFLPSTYLRFFPLQIYLGRLSFVSIAKGFTIMVAWVLILNFLVKYIWQKGLKSFTAVGI